MGKTKAQLQQDNRDLKERLETARQAAEEQDTQLREMRSELVEARANLHQTQETLRFTQDGLKALMRRFSTRANVLVRARTNRTSHEQLHEAEGIEQVVSHLSALMRDPTTWTTRQLQRPVRQCGVCTAPVVQWSSLTSKDGWRAACICSVGEGDSEGAAEARRSARAAEKLHLAAAREEAEVVQDSSCVHCEAMSAETKRLARELLLAAEHEEHLQDNVAELEQECRGLRQQNKHLQMVAEHQPTVKLSVAPGTKVVIDNGD